MLCKSGQFLYSAYHFIFIVLFAFNRR